MRRFRNRIRGKFKIRVWFLTSISENGANTLNEDGSQSILDEQ